jgi:hypothetical protein
MTATYEESQIRLLAYPIDEKWAADQDDLVNCQARRPAQSHCCKGRKWNVWVKGALAALLATILILGSFLAMSLLCPEVHSLFKRQSSGNTTVNSTESAFTQHKYWIIIVVVGGSYSES